LSSIHQMPIIDKLASSLGQRNERPNEELAEQIAKKNDNKAVQELIDLLKNKDRNIQSDAIKTLDEVGARRPELIAAFIKEFIQLLDSKNNRLQWGAMTAIDRITLENPKAVYAALPRIIALADAGSVITRDHAVGILTKLCAVKQYADNAFSLLLEQLKNCPTNQLPMYAENAAPVINAKNKAAFIKALQSRLDEMEKESKKKRVEKVINKINKSVPAQ
jgi:hypothetical protein